MRHHRPFYVSHSNVSLRYTVLCKQGCMWGVWARVEKISRRWKITKVVQPHTCGSSEGQVSHAQNTAKYLGRRIVGVVKADLDGTIAGLVETIYGFISYRVSYSKAWRAKQHAIELLYGG